MDISRQSNKNNLERGILSLLAFRKQMSTKLSLERVMAIWGETGLNKVRILKAEHPGLAEYFTESTFELNSVAHEKYIYAKANLNLFLIKDWVKFIGISGSVGAESAAASDDIDLFIVVKDHHAWLYRGVIKLRGLFNKKIRRAKEFHSPDKFCDNFICEERSLSGFKNDIFIFHELFYLKAIFNPAYFEKIKAEISWLGNYGVDAQKVESKVSPASVFIIALNQIAYVAQVVEMYLMGHKPDRKRITKNYKSGKVIFYPKTFKEKILSIYEKELAKIYDIIRS